MLGQTDGKQPLQIRIGKPNTWHHAQSTHMLYYTSIITAGDVVHIIAQQAQTSVSRSLRSVDGQQTPLRLPENNLATQS